MEIKNIKLLNGETIVADIVSENEYSIQIKVPLVTTVNRSQSGDVYLAFAKWMPYTEMEEIITIKKQNIITITGTIKSMVTHYNNVLLELHKAGDDGLLEDSDDSEQEETNEQQSSAVETPKVQISSEEHAFDKMLATKGLNINSGKFKN